VRWRDYAVLLCRCVVLCIVARDGFALIVIVVIVCWLLTVYGYLRLIVCCFGVTLLLLAFVPWFTVVVHVILIAVRWTYGAVTDMLICCPWRCVVVRWLLYDYVFWLLCCCCCCALTRLLTLRAYDDPLLGWLLPLLGCCGCCILDVVVDAYLLRCIVRWLVLLYCYALICWRCYICLFVVVVALCLIYVPGWCSLLLFVWLLFDCSTRCLVLLRLLLLRQLICYWCVVVVLQLHCCCCTVTRLLLLTLLLLIGVDLLLIGAYVRCGVCYWCSWLLSVCRYVTLLLVTLLFVDCCCCYCCAVVGCCCCVVIVGYWLFEPLLMVRWWRCYIVVPLLLLVQLPGIVMVMTLLPSLTPVGCSLRCCCWFNIIVCSVWRCYVWWHSVVVAALLLLRWWYDEVRTLLPIGDIVGIVTHCGLCCLFVVVRGSLLLHVTRWRVGWRDLLHYLLVPFGVVTLQFVLPVPWLLRGVVGDVRLGRCVVVTLLRAQRYFCDDYCCCCVVVDCLWNCCRLDAVILRWYGVVALWCVFVGITLHGLRCCCFRWCYLCCCIALLLFVVWRLFSVALLLIV